MQKKSVLTSRMFVCYIFSTLFLSVPIQMYSQLISLREAVDIGSVNYGKLRAKKSYADASRQTIDQAKRDYLPNLNLSAQQSYGTVNGQNGPLWGLGGLGVSSSGLPLPDQNWNAAFGALYLVNVNWEFFTFGKLKQQVRIAEAATNRDEKDYEQELFQHKVRIASAYLNLLSSQRVLVSQKKNLERAEVFYLNVTARVKNGLLPGVDSMMAVAEISKARITINQIQELIKIQNNELTQLMGETPYEITTDTSLINKIPSVLLTETAVNPETHPTRQFLQSRIGLSKDLELRLKKDALPSFTLFGIYQSRASGFNADYAQNQASYTHNYWSGINPTRYNYLFGAGFIWNLTSISRTSKKVDYQQLITRGLQQEYEAIDLELKSREDAADAQIVFSMKNYHEAPIQVQAAERAYIQRLTLYNNGLSTLTDVTTTQYTLNRAELDRDIAFTNVWQVLLIKAAATGNFNLFINEF